MGKKSSPLQTPNQKASVPSDPRWQDLTHLMKFSSHINPYACMDSTSRMAPGFPQASNIFYTSPTCFPTSLKSVFEKRCSVLPRKCCQALHELRDQKGCFDFDQLGNHVSLFSAGHPLQVSSSTNMKIFDVNSRCVKDIVEREPVIAESFKKSSWCGLDENSETDVQGSPVIEMHEEDKEELDALLFSNDGDEETSTGHSPSDVPKYQWGEVSDSVEITCSATRAKRRRLDREHDPSLMDTANSGTAWEYENDDDSSCIKVTDSSVVSKQSRKKRIRESMRVLRTMIPGGKGKDAAVVLDEAIRCLKSLRLKAKATATKQCW